MFGSGGAYVTGFVLSKFYVKKYMSTHTTLYVNIDSLFLQMEK